MRLPILVFAALAMVAGCNKGPDSKGADSKAPGSSNATAGANTPPQQPQASTPTTPANIGQPGSQGEKKEGANPVQGQVDPKQPEQHRDFQQRGDGKGPTGPDTQPKRGG